MKKITVEIESSDEVNITAESIERKWNHNLLEENRIKVKNISPNTVLADSLVAYQKWCYEHPEYDQVTETPKVEIYLKATNVR